MKSKFFETKRVKGGVLLSIRGRQAGSIYKDPDGFFAVTGFDGPQLLMETFATFDAADLFVWTHYA